MDYLVVLVTASMIALYAFIIGRSLPKHSLRLNHNRTRLATTQERDRLPSERSRLNPTMRNFLCVMPFGSFVIGSAAAGRIRGPGVN